MNAPNPPILAVEIEESLQWVRQAIGITMLLSTNDAGDRRDCAAAEAVVEILVRAEKALEALMKRPAKT